jgi:hypothetical protein
MMNISPVVGHYTWARIIPPIIYSFITSNNATDLR